METFKRFDRVSHSLYGIGQVNRVDEDLRLVEVVFPLMSGGEFLVQVHPVSLTLVEATKNA